MYIFELDTNFFLADFCVANFYNTLKINYTVVYSITTTIIPIHGTLKNGLNLHHT